MAKYVMEKPDDIIKDIEFITGNADKIFGGMTKAGAETAMEIMASTCPSLLRPYVKISKTYKTPTDGGINTKAYFSGYIPFSNPNRKWFERRNGKTSKVYRTSKGVPVDFLGILYEYGRSTAPFPKKPFLRKAFRSPKIQEAMARAQLELSGGLLESGSGSAWADIEADYIADLQR